MRSGDGEIALDTDDVEISIYTQEKEEPYPLSDARVTNLQNGAVTECPLEFSDSGKLIGGGEALNYKADIEDLRRWKLHRKVHNNRRYERVFPLLPSPQHAVSSAILVIPPFILTFLHIYIRKKMRRAQYETDLEKMKIEDLS